MSVCAKAGRVAAIFVGFLGIASAAAAAEWFVAPGGSGGGTQAAPFGRIQDALNVAQPGDIVTVRPGTYTESLRTVRDGVKDDAIRLRVTTTRGTVVVTSPGRVLTVDHAYITVEGFVFDGQYGMSDTVRVGTVAHALILRNTEVRRSKGDLVDITGADAVLIENCLLHHALNATNGRTDAHGVVAGPVKGLTIRNTEIHTFSGDGVQVDPGRAAPGWTDVTLQDMRIWLEPLPAAANGFAKGTVPGENAVDTKAHASLPRATITIRNVTAWGFRGGLITNMAAFNLKENINATLDGVTVHDSEIAFRLRGGGTTTVGAWVTLKNAVVHDVGFAYRYEDNIQNLRIWNNTLGRGVGRAFRAAASSSAGVDVRNLLTLGARPAEAIDASNLAVQEEAFVDPSRHDYRLAAGSPAIDTGRAVSGVGVDRNGVKRPVGTAPDVGAYEWQPPDPGEIVADARQLSAMSGSWRIVADSSAAGGGRLAHPDAGAATIMTPQQSPPDYFELTVPVQSGRAYRLWLRGRADQDSPLNDSVFVQFSWAVTSSGARLYGIGSDSALTVSIEDCEGCGLRGWGWQDTRSSVALLGPVVRFGESGPQVVRIQTREDGLSVDQLVLSPVAYLKAAPGALKDDTLLLSGS